MSYELGNMNINERGIFGNPKWVGVFHLIMASGLTPVQVQQMLARELEAMESRTLDPAQVELPLV